MAWGRLNKKRGKAPRKAWWLLALALLPLLIAVDWSAQHRDIGEWWRGETAKQSDTVAPPTEQDVAAAEHTVVYPALTAGGVADAEHFMQLGPHGLPPSAHPGMAGHGSSPQAQPEHASDSSSPYRGDGHGNGPGAAGVPTPGIAFLPPGGGRANQSTPSHPAPSSTPGSSTAPGLGNGPGSDTTPGGSGAPGSSTGTPDNPGIPGSSAGTPDHSGPPSTDTLLPVVDGTHPQNPPANADDPANTVPEPGTLWLLVLAVALLGMRRGFARVARARP